jgi:hypothetical protein
VPPLWYFFYPAEDQTHGVCLYSAILEPLPYVFVSFLWLFSFLFFHHKDIWLLPIKEFSFVFHVLMHNFIIVCGIEESAFFQKVT